MSPINRHLTRRPSSRQHHLTVFTNLFQSMDSPEEMTKAIKHAGKYMKKEQNKIMPPDEFCPECYSLKRKPNKDCKNHDSYWVDIEVTKLYRDIKNSGLKNATDTLAEQMVRTIANKHIKVQDTHEGKSHQRHWYLQAQKMLKKLVKEYKRVCKERYK